MNKLAFTIIFLLLSCIVVSQEYYSKIVPFNEGAPAISGIYKTNSLYYLPVIYLELNTTHSTLMVLDEEYSTRKSIGIKNFAFAPNDLTFLKDEIFFYGKDRALAKGLKYGKLQEDSIILYNMLHSKEYDFPSAIINDGKNIFCSYSHRNLDDTDRRYAIKKLDTAGNELWSRNLTEEFRRSFTWDMILSVDNNILISSGVALNDFSGVVGLIEKIDTAGNTIWTYQSEDYFDGSATTARIIELPNNQIVQLYKVDKRGDDEYIQNNWYPEPWRMAWINDDGERLFHLTSQPSSDIIPRYSDLVLGKGDYFFGIGYLEDYSDNTYTAMGLVTKFDLEGKALWSKKYFLPEYNLEDHAFNFTDLIDEGEKLTISAQITSFTGRDLWIFNLDSEGNCVEDLCTEITVISRPSKIIKIDSYQWQLAPTMVEDYLTISGDGTLQAFTYFISDYNGKKFMEGKVNNINEEAIGTSTLTTGHYLLTIQLGDGTSSSRKFFKY